MKKFNRVLAMLLALITVLATLPISVLADDWLNVDADKTKVENVTSTDVTVTVDPKALLSYIQDGDIIKVMYIDYSCIGFYFVLNGIVSPDLKGKLTTLMYSSQEHKFRSFRNIVRIFPQGFPPSFAEVLT